MSQSQLRQLQSLEPSPPQPVKVPSQSKFLVWLMVPQGIAGLFVLLTRGDNMVGIVGPFVSMAAIQAMIFGVFRVGRMLGATHHETIEMESKNAQDSE
jgi:hypothetical protein